jgi:drug/metabolite transporter (DMT)-like permease
MKKALLSMHAAVLLWGFTGVLGRAINMDFPVLVWYRMLLTALFIAVIITYRGLWQKVKPADQKVLIAVGILMGLHWVAFYGSIKFSNASVALVCLSTASIFTSMLDPWINKSKWQPVELLLGALTLSGVFLIYFLDGPAGKKPGSAITVEGLVLGVIAAILSSIFTVLNKSVASRYPARLMVFWEMFSGWIFISIAIGFAMLMGWQTWLLNPGSMKLSLLPPTHWDWIWLVVLALCCTVWAQSLALNALKKLSSFTVTLSVNLEPIYGILLAFVFFQENKELGLGFYLGVGVILLSVGLQMLRLLRPSASPGFVREKGGID